MEQYIKNSLEILVIILALVISYYELKEAIPTDSLIVLEVEKLKTSEDKPRYSLTGIVSDQDYLLDSVRITPYSDNPVIEATFKYDHYKMDVELKKISASEPPTYLISRDKLQQSFKEDKSFSWEFLDDHRFNFLFQFEGIESENTKFECKIFAVENKSIPCKIKQKAYISLHRDIPWYFLIGIGIFLIIIIEIIFLFLKLDFSRLLFYQKQLGEPITIRIPTEHSKNERLVLQKTYSLNDNGNPYEYIVASPLNPFNVYDASHFKSLLTTIKNTNFAKPFGIQSLDAVIIDTNYHFCNIFAEQDGHYKEYSEGKLYGESITIWFMWVYRQLENLIRLKYNDAH